MVLLMNWYLLGLAKIIGDEEIYNIIQEVQNKLLQ